MSDRDYKIIENIHDSGNSMVHRATRLRDNSHVILKILKHAGPWQVAAHQREYEIAASLDIDGVIRPLAMETYEHKAMIVFEDFGARSLDRLMDSGPFPIADFLRIAIRVSEILGEIHAANVIHKDINPSNIVMNPETGQIKIIDFGISTVLPRETPVIRHPESLEGTLAYISPEQTGRTNRGLDYRTDFYSLGAMFYEMLTGLLPHNYSDAVELVHAHLARMPVPPHKLGLDSEVPKPVSDIVAKLMAKNAGERYQGTFGLTADLRKCSHQFGKTGRIDEFAPGKNDISDRFTIPQRLYGRERETGILLDTLNRVGHEKNPSSEMVLVSGHSGIGKTALVREICKPLTLENGYFVFGKFDKFRKDRPYSAVVDAFRDLMNQLLSESEDRLAKWREKIRSALGPNGQLIVDVVPEAEHVLGKQPRVPDLGPEKARNRFNLVFENFMGIFIDPAHPLAIFLDDLQWADIASLELIRNMMRSWKKNLMLIGAFRDNEVDRLHPLTRIVNELRESGTRMQTIEMKPLDVSDANRLVSDTLYRDPEETAPLAKIILAKTGGNPFFLNELLKSMHDGKMIDFDHHRGRWTWSMESIRLMGLSDNVADLMLQKLGRLSLGVLESLKLASCIGGRFCLDSLTYVSGMDRIVMGGHLKEAMANGLILPLSDAYKLIDTDETANAEYKFAHDRIQQAARSLIPESKRKSIHLRIGRLFLKHIPPENRLERIFDIVNQMNRGADLVWDHDERFELASLNLDAGRKAKAATAYSLGFDYFIFGIGLLGESAWEKYRDLVLKLHVEAAETACLAGLFDETERIAKTVLGQKMDFLEKVKIHEARIMARISQNRMVDAIEIALAALKQLGVNLPAKPGKPAILKEMAKMPAVLAGKRIEDLANLPEMADPVKLAAMRMIVSISGIAYFVEPNLWPLMIFKSVGLSVKHGNSPFSPVAYVSCGMFHCAITGKIETGRRFGLLALDLVKRLRAEEQEVKVSLIFNSFIRHWKESLKQVVSDLPGGYQRGIEIGDLEFAALFAFSFCVNSQHAGMELGALEREAASYAEALVKLNQKTPLNHINIIRQTGMNLADFAENRLDLIGDIYDERSMLPVHEEMNDLAAILALYSNKAYLCYLFGEYDLALDNSLKAEKFLKSGVGRVSFTTFHHHQSLILLSQCNAVKKSDKRRHLKKVAANQKKMGKWSRHAPANHLHKWTLVEAERFRVSADFENAAACYDRAIELAGEHGYMNDEALALELAGKFYFSLGRFRTAKAYIRDARDAYERWGARAKVADLESEYPDILYTVQANRVDTDSVRMSSNQAVGTTGTELSSLDFESVMKAARAISGEIVLARLLEKMMRIVIENSGAEKACFLAEKDGGLLIRASVGEDIRHTDLSNPIPLKSKEARGMVPARIVNYAVRTRKKVAIDNAAESSRFASDPYVIKNVLKSALCVPVLSRGNLRGVLYLENNLISGAFTPERVKVVRLLSSQIAISIENAEFYNSLRESENRYRSLYENAIEGIFQVSPDGRVLRGNPALVEMFGHDPSKESAASFGKAIRYWPMGSKDRDIFFETLDRKGRIVGFETRLLRKDRSEIWVSISSRAVRDTSGYLTHYDGSMIDITERVKREKAEREREAADAANKAKSAFLANMSHEIRTPMNAIFGFAEILENEVRDDQHKQYLAAITSSGKTLLSLIDDILDLSKIEAGRMELNYHAVDPRHVMREIEDVFTLKVGGKGIEFHVEVDPALPPTVLLDEARLRQILFNLVGNAVKFTENGFVRLSAKYTPRPDRESANLAFTVRDTGIGIPTDQRELIFESFKQQARQNEAKYGGTGLGLAITKKLVEMLNGEISVESDVGKGSSFRVVFWDVLPALPKKQTDRERVSKIDPETIRFEKARVLVVDDIKPNRDLLQSYLKTQDLEIIEARDGKQAIDRAKRFRPNLILMDMKMPVIDGYEATKILKQDGDTKSIPVIAVSASAMIGEEIRIRRAGCDGFLKKPASKIDLFAELMRFLKSASASPKPEKIHNNPEKRVPPDLNAKKPGNDSALNILLVEDNRNNQMLFSHYLKTTPHLIEIAENGKIGFEKYISGQYDIVFMDLEMPVMDGLEATRQIRNREAENRTPQVPIVALTAHRSEKNQKACQDAGCTFHMVKPVVKDRILEVLDQYASNVEH